MLSRHARSAHYGLDQIIILRTINPSDFSKLIPQYYMSLYTPSTRKCFAGVSFTGYMNELRHDSPRLSHTYTHEVPGVNYMSY